MARATEPGELLQELVVTIEDLRARLSMARCCICGERLGRDPLNPPVLFEDELSHQHCAERQSVIVPAAKPADA